MTLRPLVVLALGLTAILACSKAEQATGAASGPVTTCAKANDQCVYSPGKLGLCTPSTMECDSGGQCLVCMSLH